MALSFNRSQRTPSFSPFFERGGGLFPERDDLIASPSGLSQSPLPLPKPDSPSVLVTQAAVGLSFDVSVFRELLDYLLGEFLFPSIGFLESFRPTGLLFFSTTSQARHYLRLASSLAM